MTCTLIGFLLFFQHVSLEKHPENLLRWSKPSQVPCNFLWSSHLILVCHIYHCDVYTDNWESQVWNAYTQNSPWWKNLHFNKIRGKKRERCVTEHLTSVQVSSIHLFNFFCGLPWEWTAWWNDKRRKKKWNERMDIGGVWIKQKNRGIVQSGTFCRGHGFLQGLLQHQSQHSFLPTFLVCGCPILKGRERMGGVRNEDMKEILEKKCSVATISNPSPSSSICVCYSLLAP